MKRFLIAMVAIGLSAAAGSAQAGFSVAFDPGTTNVTTALTGYSTFGDMMDGMEVTAYFGATSETAVWGDTGPGAGAASGTRWSLSESGDTWLGNWVLSNSTGVGMTRLLIDAGKGDTVYDIEWPAPSTPGSESGKEFYVLSGDTNLNILATYRDLVALSGSAPVGDLYRFLDIDFQDKPFPSDGANLVYVTDTDNILFAGDIAPIPEPASLVVWSLLGAIGLAVARRRRRR